MCHVFCELLDVVRFITVVKVLAIILVFCGIVNPCSYAAVVLLIGRRRTWESDE